MEERIRIIGIGGSFEKKSSTLALLKFVLNEIKSLGADVTLLDIKQLKLPLYDSSKGLSQAGKGFNKVLGEIHKAHGYIFASPEYHGTVSAAFKNVIDYFEFLYDDVPPYLTCKPVGCIAAAGAENSGAATLQTMISIVHSLRGITASNSISVGSSTKQIDEKGRIKNEVLERKLKRLAKETYILAVKLSVKL